MKRQLPPLFAATRWAMVTLLVSVSLMFASTAHATVMKYADLTMLVEISDVIVQGTVVKETFLQEDGHTVTRTEIKVSRTFLGEPLKTRVFQQWGGVADEKTSGVPGDARFEIGEEVILFMHTAPKSPGLFLSALGQSKYKVLKEKGGPQVWRKLDDLAFLEEGSAPTRVSARPDEKLGYDSFVAELEALIAAMKGGAK